MRCAKTQAFYFWSKVCMCEHGRGCQTCCWPWKKCIGKLGYGRTKFVLPTGRETYAHRIAYILTHGPLLLPTLEICHDCPQGDFPACCNPAHLWVGTHYDNMCDKEHKGRGSKTHAPYGEMVKQSKLRETDVIEIWRLWVEEGWDTRQIALHFGVSQPNICYILNGKAWKHIPCPYPLSDISDRYTPRKLTRFQVTCLRKDAQRGTDRATLASRYGISRQHVNNILRGAKWGTPLIKES